jgi:hypothetical protein
MVDIPQFFRLRQLFDAIRVEDIPATVSSELARLQLHERIRPGASVAITAGSRGVANIHLIIKAIAGHLKSLGAAPFIVPAMGSHAGGTAEGQRKLIEGYGVTEEFCGCPIRSSMETVIVAQTAEGFPVHFDKNAYEADHVLVCNRVKPHTNFVGEIESGLCKMMLIGLGKHAGAKIYHRAIQDYSFPQILKSVASQVLAKCKIVAGLAVVENGYDETARIAAVSPGELMDREKELLTLAKSLMPRLPFQNVDVLILDQIGKNISGSGMDTNVVGRKFHDHQAAESEFPKVKRIIVRGLTPETHGNAAGIGIAEFCKTRVVQAMDRRTTVINCLTGGHPSGAMVPVYFDTDLELFEAALGNIGLVEPHRAKILWIKNTLQVANVECSAAYLGEARQRRDLEILSGPRNLPWDDSGNLPDYAAYAGNGAH